MTMTPDTALCDYTVLDPGPGDYMIRYAPPSDKSSSFDTVRGDCMSP